MSNVPTRLIFKYYIKPHSMGLEKKSRFISPGVYAREFDTTTLQYEDRVVHRYIMDIHDHNRGVQSFFVRLNTRPSIVNDPIEIHHQFMSTRGFGRMEWQPLEIKLIDTIGENSSVDYFRNWMTEGCEYITGRQGYARDYKKRIELSKLDPVGMVVEKWALDGAQIQELNHQIIYDETRGDIEMRIIYDNAHIIY